MTHRYEIVWPKNLTKEQRKRKESLENLNILMQNGHIFLYVAVALEVWVLTIKISITIS